AGESAKGDLAGGLDSVKTSGGDKALKDIGDAAGDMAGKMGGAAGASRGLGSMLGGLVGGLIGSAGVAVALGLVNRVVASYKGYQEDMAEGAEIAGEKIAGLRDYMEDLAEETGRLTVDVRDLAAATRLGADMSYDAADAYLVQAAAARQAAKDIRDMTAAERAKREQEIKTELAAVNKYISGGGPWDLVTTDQAERTREARRKLLEPVTGRRLSGFDGPDDDRMIAFMQDNRGQLTPAALARLQDYERQTSLLAGAQAKRTGLEAEAAAFAESYRPGALTAPTFEPEEIVVTADPANLRGGRGGGGGRGGADRLSDAERETRRRLEISADLERGLRMETAALAAQEAAAGKGAAALEDLRVAQAGLTVMQRLGVETLDGLTTAEILAADAAIEAAKAAERQAIATEKAMDVARVTDGLDVQIKSTEGYNAALMAGEKALVDYALAEAQRQAVEQAGANLTPDQVKAIKDRVAALEQLKAVTEGLEDSRAFAEELRLAQMSTTEREREVRVIALRNRYLRDGTASTEQEAEARARIAASYEQEMRRRAEDIGRLGDQLRAEYIDSGKLGFDEVGEYAQRRLREAVYDAFSDPIDIVINAAVNVVGEGIQTLLGGGGGRGGGLLGGLGQLFGLGGGAGGASGGGLLSGLAGLFTGPAGGTVSGSIMSGIAGIGGLASSIGGMLGLGGAAAAGGAIAGGIGGLGSAVGGMAGTMAGGASAIGAMGGMSLLGPIGAALAIGTLLLGNKKPSNNGANAVFDQDGGFVVGGAKRNRETEAAATSAARSISSLIETLGAAGIDAGGVISKIQVGTRDPGRIILSDGSSIKTAKGDMQALVEAAGKAMLRGADFENPQMERLVDQMLAANKSFEEIVAKLDQFVAAQAVGDDLKLRLQAFQDPEGYALKVLENSQKARRDQIDDWADEGFYSESQLAEIRATLDALENAELVDALERLGIGAVGAAKALENARPRLQDWLDSFGFTDAAQMNPAEERQLAMAQYERLLEKAKTGDVDALGKITGASDRLIETDEAATSSATERLALANKIRADIAGLIALSGPLPGDALAAIGGSSVTTDISPVLAATEEGNAQLITLTAEVAGLRADLAVAMARLSEAMGGGGAAIAGELQGLADMSAGQLSALQELLRDARMTGALAAAAAARITQ
ncbi:MAG: hypothetical protein Q8J89_02040, partial [Caulobacter sp.]|nr:hypothetical protein [Caulobacter sp.]